VKEEEKKRDMLRSNVGGIELNCCVYNAAGPRTISSEDLIEIGKSHSGAILSKSATLLSREGNEMPRSISNIDLGGGTCQGSMNAEGLPNRGIDYYISSAMTEKLSVYEKPYIVSIAGLSLEENMEMIKMIEGVEGIAGIELNLSCPNVAGKPITSYDFEQLKNVLKAVTSLSNKKPFGIKLAPYLDMQYFAKVVSIIAKFPINYIVTSNCLGNAMFVDYDLECVSIAPYRGGLAGGYIKHVALSNVHMLAQLLREVGREDIDIVGVGGVATGKDAFELILCGAKAVQIATTHWHEGPTCFNRIASELESIMKQKGYSTVDEFRGMLKPYMKSPTNGTNGSNDDKKQTLPRLDSIFGIPLSLVYLQWVVIIVLTIMLLFPLTCAHMFWGLGLIFLPYKLMYKLYDNYHL